MKSLKEIRAENKKIAMKRLNSIKAMIKTRKKRFIVLVIATAIGASFATAFLCNMDTDSYSFFEILLFFFGVIYMFNCAPLYHFSIAEKPSASNNMNAIAYYLATYVGPPACLLYYVTNYNSLVGIFLVLLLTSSLALNVGARILRSEHRDYILGKKDIMDLIKLKPHEKAQMENESQQEEEEQPRPKSTKKDKKPKKEKPNRNNRIIF